VIDGLALPLLKIADPYAARLSEKMQCRTSGLMERPLEALLRIPAPFKLAALD